MSREGELLKLLQAIQEGKTTPEAALGRLQRSRFSDIGFARVDIGRKSRCGFPEVIYAEGKEADQIAAIARKLISERQDVIITRLDKPKYSSIRRSLPRLKYSALGRTAWLRAGGTQREGEILVVTAGTSDIPVAEEAAAVCEALGFAPERLFDAGVAGLHRLLADSDKISRARVIIVVAGMEGALPSIVGGLIDIPVIAVPTSVGYGTSFGGVTALLGMLNSCASGVTVVNIDNGFGAAVAAVRILRLNAARK